MTSDFPVRPFLRAFIPRLLLTSAPRESMTHESCAVHLGSRLCWGAGLAEFEQVEIFNATRSIRTLAHVRYGAEGEVVFPTSTGPLMRAGDVLQISAYAWISNDAVKGHTCTIAQVDEGNRLIEFRQVPARIAVLDPASYPQPPAVEIVTLT